MPIRCTTHRGAIALFLLASVVAQPLQCAQDVTGLASEMLESNIGRGDGIESGGQVNGLIELGIFHQALRESIGTTQSTEKQQKWTAYLHNTTLPAFKTLESASKCADLPLDRFAVGTSLIHQTLVESKVNATVAALRGSIALQPRNDDGSLWYFNNVANITAYRNLSYLDGMYSYPTFAILSTNYPQANSNSGPSAALGQIELLYNRCKDSNGLIRHGFDAAKSHAWADSTTGCSPVIWGRALAWYTLGILESLEVLQSSPASKTIFHRLRRLFVKLVEAQLRASTHSLRLTGKHGVWQIVDHPGATFNGSSNFVEASGSLLTSYSFLKGVRLGLFQDELAQKVQLTGVKIYQGALQDFLIRNRNGSLSLNGTSSVASLAGNVDFPYYASRPTLLNSLKGTSAFILASLEVEKICRTDSPGHSSSYSS